MSSRNGTHGYTPIGFVARFLVGTLAAIMIPPFVVLAIAPMLLLLLPVALCAIPFMLSAFAGEAREVPVAPRRLAVLRPAHAHR
jgi:hypothetical protein